MPGFLSRILPRGEDFGGMFVALADNIHQGSKILVDLLQMRDSTHNNAERIKDLELLGDNMTHNLMTRLNQTFITPFDREDIYLLASRIDDVLDLTDAAGSAMVTYRIDRVRPGVVDLAKVLHQATGQVVEAVRVLGKQDNILKICVEIHRLENEGDRLSRALIAELFEQEKDPVQIIKWKEIIEVIETGVDKCEDVANVLETITLKNS
jgi:predicted phosphate transport protein (TIGR00153 family)